MLTRSIFSPLPGTGPSPPRVAFCPSVCTYGAARAKKCSPAGLPGSSIAAFSSVCEIVCSPTPLYLHHHPALAPPTRSHVRYMHTPCLLECNHGNGAPAAQLGRGGDGGSSGERKRTSIHPPVHESVTLIIEATLFKRQIFRLQNRMNALGDAFIYYFLK